MYKLRDKFDISEIIDIFTNEDMENTPPESRMWFRMNFMSRLFSMCFRITFTSGTFSGKTLVFI